MSYREVAKIGIASGTVYNRIKKMTDNGVIKGSISLLDYRKLGYCFTALIPIQVEGKNMTEVEEKLATQNEVLSV